MPARSEGCLPSTDRRLRDKVSLLFSYLILSFDVQIPPLPLTDIFHSIANLVSLERSNFMVVRGFRSDQRRHNTFTSMLYLGSALSRSSPQTHRISSAFKTDVLGKDGSPEGLVVATAVKNGLWRGPKPLVTTAIGAFNPPSPRSPIANCRQQCAFRQLLLLSCHQSPGPSKIKAVLNPSEAEHALHSLGERARES